MCYYEKSGKISNIKQTVKNHMSGDDWFNHYEYYYNLKIKNSYIGRNKSKMTKPFTDTSIPKNISQNTNNLHLLMKKMY